MAFNMRTSKPSAGNKFYNNGNNGGYSWCINGSPTDKGCNVLANCVGYACGRFNEIIGSMKYKTLCCNAENFIEKAKSAGLEISAVPTLGGIMVWQKGNTLNGKDGAGHVAVVEKIIDKNTIYTSESGYGSSAFWNSTRNNNNGRWGLGCSYKFRGCIVNPAIGKVVATESNNQSQSSNSQTKFNVGDKVIINGSLYRSSNASTPAGKISNRKTVITRVEKGTSHPYNTTGDLGWMDESSITLIGGSYSKGNYKTLGNMNVRTGAGTNYAIKKVKDLSTDGKRNATSTNLNANAVYKTGTVFTAIEIINENGVWAKTPSGYVCIKDVSGKVYCSKV